MIFNKKRENKLLPIAWQAFAMPMARLCQRLEKRWQNSLLIMNYID
jgi:hypothetical protein